MESGALKRAAAAVALELVRPKMRLGIGTGSTAEEFIRLLAGKLRGGFEIVGVPTSERSRALCAALNVPLADLEEMPHLDMAVDGADELDSRLRLIKGGGGALLREKITAYAAAEMVVIADESKKVRTLGAFPLPIEVNPFGLRATALAVRVQAAKLGLGGEISLRRRKTAPAAAGKPAAPFVTDGGHYILDAHFGEIKEPQKLAAALCEVAGVVEHGLFFHPHCRAVLARADGTIEHITGENH